MIRKIGVYFLSLWLLFLLLIIIKVEIPIYLGSDWEFVGFKILLMNNIIPLICVLSMMIGGLSYYDFNYKTQGTPELSFEITKIENINYEHLTFLTTYIIPLACINMKDLRYTIVLVTLLIVVGLIFIRTNIFYMNPTLAILKYRIYKVTGNFRKDQIREDIVLICKEKLDLNDCVRYIKLDEKIYYAYKE